MRRLLQNHLEKKPGEQQIESGVSSKRGEIDEERGGKLSWNTWGNEERGKYPSGDAL